MHADSPVRRGAAAPLIGSDELAEGLMLVRESTLKVIRFQLAMERHDRKVALETVDDLVALDRKLRDYLGDVPAPELEVQRAALNREKLTLAAEVIRPEPKAAEAVAPPAENWDNFAFEAQHPRRATWWLVAVLVLLSAGAAAGYWFAGPNVPAKIMELAS